MISLCGYLTHEFGLGSTKLFQLSYWKVLRFIPRSVNTAEGLCDFRYVHSKRWDTGMYFPLWD